MAGRTPNEAVDAFVEPIKKAMGCFASCKVSADVFDPDIVGVLSLNRGEPVPLKKTPGGPRIELDATIRYTIVPADDERGPWKVHTEAWVYELFRDGERLIVFHWHPGGRIGFPHLHVEALTEHSKLHVPTGRVLLEDVLTLAHELGAKPAEGWAAIMQSNRERFTAGATWGAGFA